MEVIVFNDLHLADVPPLGRKPGYKEEGLAMLRELVQLARRHDAPLITTGDLFHIKRPDRTSHRLVQEVIDILRSGSVTFLVVPGNHDMTERGLDSLDGQPLGVLKKAGVAQLFTGMESYDGVSLIGRPYDMHRDADPHYYELTPEELRDRERGGCVVFAHGSLLPPGAVRPYPCVTVDQLNWTGIDVLASGHIHEDLGTHELAPGTIFTNVGALGRVARTEANRTRKVKCVSIAFHEYAQGAVPGTVVEIPLTSAMQAQDIFIEEVLAEAAGDDAIGAFIESLGATFFTEGADLRELVAQADASDSVKARLLHYCELAGA
jgi:DNA repair exonuclease SbcCD nuclease subunit